jgi:hypothetical protein
MNQSVNEVGFRSYEYLYKHDERFKTLAIQYVQAQECEDSDTQDIIEQEMFNEWGVSPINEEYQL